MALNGTAGLSRRALLETSAGLGAGAALAGLLPSGTRPRRHAYAQHVVVGRAGAARPAGLCRRLGQDYTAATVKPMLQDTAVVISQFQTAAAAGNAPDIQFLWNGIYHMESVWLGYLQPLDGLINDEVLKARNRPCSATSAARPTGMGWYAAADDLDLQQGRCSRRPGSIRTSRPRPGTSSSPPATS